MKSQVKVHIARFNLRELRLLLNVVIQLKFRKKKGWQVLVGHPQEIKERMFSTQGIFFFEPKGTGAGAFGRINICP